MTPDEMRRAAELLTMYADRVTVDDADGADEAENLAAKLRAMADAAERPLPPPPEAK